MALPIDLDSIIGKEFLLFVSSRRAAAQLAAEDAGWIKTENRGKIDFDPSTGKRIPVPPTIYQAALLEIVSRQPRRVTGFEWPRGEYVFSNDGGMPFLTLPPETPMAKYIFIPREMETTEGISRFSLRGEAYSYRRFTGRIGDLQDGGLEVTFAHIPDEKSEQKIWAPQRDGRLYSLQ